jgi:hypothetical protein
MGLTPFRWRLRWQKITLKSKRQCVLPVPKKHVQTGETRLYEDKVFLPDSNFFGCLPTSYRRQAANRAASSQINGVDRIGSKKFFGNSNHTLAKHWRMRAAMLYKVTA